MDPRTVDQNFQATMKVKTVERDGLIFYVADDTQVRKHCFVIYS